MKNQKGMKGGATGVGERAHGCRWMGTWVSTDGHTGVGWWTRGGTPNVVLRQEVAGRYLIDACIHGEKIDWMVVGDFFVVGFIFFVYFCFEFGIMLLIGLLWSIGGICE